MINNPIQTLGYHNIEIVIYKEIKAVLKIQLIK